MNDLTPLTRGSLAAIGRQTAREAKDDVRAFFLARKEAIAGLVAGKMDVDRLLLVAHTAIMKDPKLAQCTVSSLFGATIVAGLLRLEPNTPTGHLYFIPREVKGRWEVTIQIGYKGRALLALRSPLVKDLSTHVVHANDKYRVVEGSNPHIYHEPLMTDPRGAPLFYYARAQLRSGNVVFEYMTVADIEAHRDRYSDAYKSAVASIAKAEREGNAWLAKYIREHTPWIAQFDAMARKTVLVALCTRQLPVDTAEQAIAAAIDDESKRQHLGAVLEMENLDDLSISPPVSDLDPEGDARTIDAEPSKNQSIVTENITEVITREEKPATKQEVKHEAPKPDETKTEAKPDVRDEKRPAPSRDLLGDKDKQPWYVPLGLAGRSLTAAQKATNERGIDTIEKARLFDWTSLGRVGDVTLADLRSTLGIEAPEATYEEVKPETPKAAAPPTPERPALQRGPATKTGHAPPSDDDEEFGFEVSE